MSDTNYKLPCSLEEHVRMPIVYMVRRNIMFVALLVLDQFVIEISSVFRKKNN